MLVLIEVAEMYYKKDMNQMEIAKKIGVSRPSISRMLEEARATGIVKITVEAPITYMSNLADELKERFSLDHVVVFETTGDYRFDTDNIGKVAARFVDTVLENNNTVGITWGQAVESFVHHIKKSDVQGVNVVQLNGSLGTIDSEDKGVELIMSLAKKLNGSYETFNAPAFVDSERLQKELLHQKQIQNNLSNADKAQVVFTGIGNLKSPHNTLMASGHLSKEEAEILKEKGAVGHIIGRIYDINGQEIVYENIYPIANRLKMLSRIKHSIGGAVSASRAEATLGAIRASLINVLICDNTLAKELIRLDNK